MITSATVCMAEFSIKLYKSIKPIELVDYLCKLDLTMNTHGF